MKTDVLSKFGTEVLTKVGKMVLQGKKYSPEILVGAGIVGIVTSTVLACKATRDIDEVLDKTKNEIEDVKIKMEKTEDDSLMKRELTVTYIKGVGRMAKLYAPSIILGTASITSIVCSHSILRKRNVALAAAYSAVDEGFKKYRDRVISELGDEADKRFRYGTQKQNIEIEEEDENGKIKKKKVKGEVIDPSQISDYAKFFDEGCINWSKDPETNLFFLKQQERYANEMLRARGNVFLNEVYDMLDIPRTKAGSVVGWVLGNGDDYIDFGIYDLNREANRRFVNKDEAVILLDFNVDGVIYDLI